MKKKATLAIVGTLMVGATLVVERVRAGGIPDAQALTYSGYLETPDGKAVTGDQNIGIAVYDAETGGDEVCRVKSQEVALASGRFQVELPDDCTEGVSAKADLWIEVEVNGSGLGRSKLGAVPYAVEAGHAVTADRATTADEAEIAERTSVITDWVEDPDVKCLGIPNATEIEAQTTTSFWRRVGDSIEIQIQTAFTGEPSGTVQLMWTLPEGISIDPAVDRGGPYGIAFHYNTPGDGPICYAYGAGDYQHVTAWCSTGAFSTTGFGDGSEARLRATFPVEGWSN